MSQPPREPTEDELRAAYEEQLKQIQVRDVLLQTIVSLVNLGGRRLGLAPGSENERDLDQVRDAIDAVRALLPLAEREDPAEMRPVRDALAQLQMAYAKEQGATPADATGTGETGAGEPAGPGPKGRPEDGEAAAAEGSGSGPGPAQSSGRLWVPGR